MHEQTSSTSVKIVTYGALSAIGLISICLPRHLTVPNAAASAPDQITMLGVVRDFRPTHTDFEVSPASGPDHVAGLVVPTLALDGRPVLAPPSSETGPVDNRIAHWKFDEGAGGTVHDDLGLNPGALESAPTWVPGRTGGALHFDGVDDYVNIPNSPEMQIAGDITFTGWFKLDEDFNTSSPTTMLIMEKFYDVSHDFHIGLVGNDYSGSLAHGSGMPFGRLVFKVETISSEHSARYVWTNQDTWVAGTWYHFAAVLSSSDPSTNHLLVNGVDDTAGTWGIGAFIDTNYDAPLRIGGRTFDNGFADDVYFKGTIDDVLIFDRALQPVDFASIPGYRVDLQWKDRAGENIAPRLYTPAASNVDDACGNSIEDVAGVPGAPSGGDIASAASFDEWYRDVLGTNLSAAVGITLTNQAGVYEYLDDQFHPIDGRLFGNEALDPHNYFFTYAITADFVYTSCGGQFLEFEGDDGTWVFIDDRLALDLGGVGSVTEQRVDFDRLGLTDGDTYSVRIFYSQRTRTSSIFRLRTNAVLSSRDNVVSAGFD